MAARIDRNEEIASLRLMTKVLSAVRLHLSRRRRSTRRLRLCRRPAWSAQRLSSMSRDRETAADFRPLAGRQRQPQ